MSQVGPWSLFDSPPFFVHTVIETILAFMHHHFPLFPLMLRMKDPWRLPGKFICSYAVCCSLTFCFGDQVCILHLETRTSTVTACIVVPVEIHVLEKACRCLATRAALCNSHQTRSHICMKVVTKCRRRSVPLVLNFLLVI